MSVHLLFQTAFRFRLSELLVATIIMLWSLLVQLNPTMVGQNPAFAAIVALGPNRSGASALC